MAELGAKPKPTRRVKLPLPLVKVIWHDAAADNGWKDQTDTLDDKPEEATTIGFLIKEAENHIFIASTFASGDGLTQHNARMKIPLNMVVSCEEIGIAVKRKPKVEKPDGVA